MSTYCVSALKVEARYAPGHIRSPKVNGVTELPASKLRSLHFIFFIVTFFTRVASEAKRAERNEVERVCGGEGGVPSASW